MRTATTLYPRVVASTLPPATAFPDACHLPPSAVVLVQPRQRDRAARQLHALHGRRRPRRHSRQQQQQPLEQILPRRSGDRGCNYTTTPQHKPDFRGDPLSDCLCSQDKYQLCARVRHAQAPSATTKPCLGLHVHVFLEIDADLGLTFILGDSSDRLLADAGGHSRPYYSRVPLG